MTKRPSLHTYPDCFIIRMTGSRRIVGWPHNLDRPGYRLMMIRAIKKEAITDEIKDNVKIIRCGIAVVVHEIALSSEAIDLIFQATKKFEETNP